METPGEGFSEDLDISVVEDDSSDGSSEGSEEREPVTEISLFFIYMNADNAIERVETDIESVAEGTGAILKERLLQIIQDKRAKKYKVVDILSFQIPLEYDELDGDSFGYLKPVPIFNDVLISPALYIFHDLTALYFFFAEQTVRTGRKGTKKVRFHIDHDNGMSYSDHKRKSLKRFLRRGNGGTHKLQN